MYEEASSSVFGAIPEHVLFCCAKKYTPLAWKTLNKLLVNYTMTVHSLWCDIDPSTIFDINLTKLNLHTQKICSTIAERQRGMVRCSCCKEWKCGTGKQNSIDIIRLPSTTVTQST